MVSFTKFPVPGFNGFHDFDGFARPHPSTLWLGETTDGFAKPKKRFAKKKGSGKSPKNTTKRHFAIDSLFTKNPAGLGLVRCARIPKKPMVSANKKRPYIDYPQ